MSDTEIGIKEFLTKMAVQDNRGTAAPYYYTIRTEEESVCGENDYDEVRYYHNEQTFNSMSEIKNLVNSGELDECVLRRAEKYFIKKRWKHVGVFLTESDAANHLKQNSHHYTENAHTYVDHAWRAPELKKFFEDLFKHFEIDRGDWR